MVSLKFYTNYVLRIEEYGNLFALKYEKSRICQETDQSEHLMRLTIILKGERFTGISKIRLKLVVCYCA